MAKSTNHAAELDELRTAIDLLHHDLAYRAGGIAQAAFALAQYKALHAEVTGFMGVMPGLKDGLKGMGINWDEPGSLNAHALPELLRELCVQLTDLAGRVEELAVRPAAEAVGTAGGANHG